MNHLQEQHGHIIEVLTADVLESVRLEIEALEPSTKDEAAQKRSFLRLLGAMVPVLDDIFAGPKGSTGSWSLAEATETAFCAGRETRLVRGQKVTDHTGSVWEMLHVWLQRGYEPPSASAHLATVRAIVGSDARHSDKEGVALERAIASDEGALVIDYIVAHRGWAFLLATIRVRALVPPRSAARKAREVAYAALARAGGRIVATDAGVAVALGDQLLTSPEGWRYDETAKEAARDRAAQIGLPYDGTTCALAIVGQREDGVWQATLAGRHVVPSEEEWDDGATPSPIWATGTSREDAIEAIRAFVREGEELVWIEMEVSP